MTYRNLKIAFYSLFSAGLAGCISGAIIGIVNKESGWGIGGIIFVVCAISLMAIPGIVIAVIHLQVIQNENNLVLKEYGAPKSKTKTYFYHIHTDLSIPALFEKPKAISGLKFSPEGLYYNTLQKMFLWKEIFLWENVERISIAENAIKIEVATREGIKFITGFPNTEIYFKLVKTFCGKEIQQEQMQTNGDGGGICPKQAR